MNESKPLPDSMITAFDRHRPLLPLLSENAGLVGYCGGRSPRIVTIFDAAEGRIPAIHLVDDPAKLGSVPQLDRARRGEGPQ